VLRIVGGIVVVAVVVAGIGTFLQPDDLKDCGDRPSSKTNCQTVDAIVAVSGGDTEARTNEAISLYKSGWAPKLVFSGAAEDKTGPSNAAAMKKIAVVAGVSEADIYTDEYSANTKQNAENVRMIFADNQIKKVILVTSGYHQKRASLEFNKRTTGVTIINHPVASDKDWSSMWFLTPRGWILAVSEIFKIALFYVTSLWS
jgi:uncharacterized SAM-binding protein YcdF (DUF218 family)